MVSALDSGLRGFESWPGHCIVFLGKTPWTRLPVMNNHPIQEE